MNAVTKESKRSPRSILREIRKEADQAFSENRLREWIDSQIGVEAADSLNWGKHPGYHIDITVGLPTIWINTGTQTLHCSYGFKKRCHIDLGFRLCESLEKIIRDDMKVAPITTVEQLDIAFVRDDRRKKADLNDDEFVAYMHKVIEMETAMETAMGAGSGSGKISRRNQATLKYIDRNYGIRKKFTVVR